MSASNGETPATRADLQAMAAEIRSEIRSQGERFETQLQVQGERFETQLQALSDRFATVLHETVRVLSSKIDDDTAELDRKQEARHRALRAEFLRGVRIYNHRLNGMEGRLQISEDDAARVRNLELRVEELERRLGVDRS